MLRFFCAFQELKPYHEQLIHDTQRRLAEGESTMPEPPELRVSGVFSKAQRFQQVKDATSVSAAPVKVTVR